MNPGWLFFFQLCVKNVLMVLALHASNGNNDSSYILLEQSVMTRIVTERQTAGRLGL